MRRREVQIAAVQRGPVAARGDGMSEVAVTQPVSVALVCLRTSSLSRYTACMHTRLLCAHTLASCAHKCPTEQRHPQYQQPRVRGFSVDHGPWSAVSRERTEVTVGVFPAPANSWRRRLWDGSYQLPSTVATTMSFACQASRSMSSGTRPTRRAG